MKFLAIMVFMVTAFTVSAQVEELKSKMMEVKKVSCTMVNGEEDCTVSDVKKKACPMVNGKEDCSVAEVKTKIIEVKKKITN